MVDPIRLPFPVAEKKSSRGKYLPFAAQHKLHRTILLLLGQRLVLDIAKDNPDFEIALDRASIHTEANDIGTIRSLLRHADRAASVLHRIARYEFCQRQFSSRSVSRANPRRATLSGVQLIHGECRPFQFQGTRSGFAAEVLSLITLTGELGDAELRGPRRTDISIRLSI
jgi:hypothetical protein